MIDTANSGGVITAGNTPLFIRYQIASVGYVDLYSFILIIVFERKNVTTHLSGASLSGAHEDHLGVAMSAKSGPYILRELPIKAPIRT